MDEKECNHLDCCGYCYQEVKDLKKKLKFLLRRGTQVIQLESDNTFVVFNEDDNNKGLQMTFGNTAEQALEKAMEVAKKGK